MLLAGALFATGGALLKGCDFPSLERAGLRSLLAAIVILTILPEARRWPTRRMLLLVPAFFAATCLFVVANTLTTAANAIFLQSTAPLWVSLLSPWLLRERAARADLLVLVGIGAGMALVFAAPTAAVATAPNPRLGDAIAFGSGIGYALLLVGMRWLGRDGAATDSRGAGEGPAAIAWGSIATAPLAFALMPVVGQTPILGSGRDWLAIGTLAVFQVGIAYALLVRAAARVPALQVSLLLMIEPALNPLLTMMVHDERPPAQALAGGALIIGAVAVRCLVAARRTGRPAAG